jgi:hypothetical protein
VTGNLNLRRDLKYLAECVSTCTVQFLRSTREGYDGHFVLVNHDHTVLKIDLPSFVAVNYVRNHLVGDSDNWDALRSAEIQHCRSGSS